MRNNNSIAKRSTFADPDSLASIDSDYGDFDEYYGSSPEITQRAQVFGVLGILRKRWWIIVLVALLGTASVIIYEASKPDYYTAQARIQVNNESNPGVGGNVVLNSGSDPGYFTTQLQILEGAGLLRRVVKTMDLEHNDTFFRPAKGQETGTWQNVQRMIGISNRPPPVAKAGPTPEGQMDFKSESASDLDGQAEVLAPYVNSIRRNLEVNPIKDNRTANKETRLINVEFTHSDPVLATKVVNTLADTYVLQNLEQKIQTNESAGDFLQKRVAELQSEIRSGEEQLINYAKSNQILSLDSGQNTVVQRLGDLNGKLSQAENDRITAEAAYRAAMQNPMNGSNAESKDSRTAGLEQQLTTLRQQLEQLKVEYTDEWPEVKKTKRQIDAIEKELQTNKKRSSDTQIAGLEQTFRETSARENELKKEFDAQRDAVLKQNEAAINYRIIQQEIDTNKGLLNNLLQRSRETDVILNGTTNNVRIVDRALVPVSPAGPQRTKNVLIGFLASLFVGVGIAFLLNWLDDTIRISDNFEALLGVPVLAMIPKASKPGFANRLLTSKFHGKENGLKRVGKHVYELDSFDKPLITEAFHQLRTSLLLSTAGGSPKTILVTSGEPFEGKTVSSLNLAKSLAQLGKKVLLIDADLRCPKMHVINEIDNSRGLSNLLISNDLNGEMLGRAIQKHPEKHLDILPSGPTVPSPANLFGSQQMRGLLEKLGDIYSFVVIDSPPVLYFADSVILSASVDAVVLVARANYGSRDVLSIARRKMQDVRANVVGVVINDVPLGNYRYYKNSYYTQLEQAEVAEAGASLLHLD